MGDFGKTKDKWVCPNDRALTLRAQLKKGWSVKTDSDNSFSKPEQLNDGEQELIMNVIKRAENIDKSEQERVGRLVERLENMKKNAMGNGASQCVLCADEFGLLGASPLLCNDCKKAVCTKCSVDTISAHKEPLWLCKICAETRETWKKSGAWFYKGLPKYVLPERKSDQQGRYYTSVASSSHRPHSEQNISSPICSYNAWLPGKGRSSSDKEYTDSSDDELKSGLLAKKQTIQQKFLSDSVESADTSTFVLDIPQQVPKISQTPSLPYVITDTDTGFTVTKEIVEDVPEVVPVTYQRDQKQELFRSPTRNHGEQQSHVEDSSLLKMRREGEESDGRLQRKPHKSHARRDSISSAENYCNGRSRVNKQNHGVPQQARQQLSYSDVSLERSPAHRSAPALENVHSPESAASSLEFSVLYDQHNQALHCTIYRAKGLRATDYDGLADPFVRLQLVPGQSKDDRMRTRTVHKTLNPEFNETVSFFGIVDYDLAKRKLRLTVMDEDPFGNDFMCETCLSLRKVRPNQPKHFHVYLDHAMELNDDEDDDDLPRSQILISLMYSSEHHALIVGVLRCIQLPPRDNHSTGYCDPYVKIALKPDPLRRRYKTVAKKKTLNPEYNEEFVFEVKPHEMTKKTLEISVWDKDYGKAEEYIGGVALGVQAKGDRLYHWLDTIRNSDRRIERWHPLSNTIMLD